MTGKNFFFKGIFFEHENDFWEYVKIWPETSLSEESLSQMLDLLKKDILSNLQFGLEIKNGEMNHLLEKTFLKAMHLRKKSTIYIKNT